MSKLGYPNSRFAVGTVILFEDPERSYAPFYAVVGNESLPVSQHWEQSDPSLVPICAYKYKDGAAWRTLNFWVGWLEDDWTIIDGDEGARIWAEFCAWQLTGDDDD